MRGLNKVILIGNLGKDPEIQTFESGRKRASFSLATTESFRDKEGVMQSATEWHNIVVWGPQVDIVEKYLKKGAPLYVEGKIRTREYTAQDGATRRITEINVLSLILLGGRQDSENQYSNYSAAPAPSANDAAPFDSISTEIAGDPKDDLPF